MLEQEIHELWLAYSQPGTEQQIAVLIGELGVNEGPGLDLQRVPRDHGSYGGRQELAQERSSNRRSFERRLEQGIVGASRHTCTRR